MAKTLRTQLWHLWRRLENRFSEILGRDWSELRGISNSYAAKSTILIPLVGYWIIFNESIFSWLHLTHQLGGHQPSDHTRVRWMYMGLCAIAAGTFIYALRCPPEVKKYGDFKDYVNGDGPAIERDEIEDIRETLDKSGYTQTFDASEKEVLTIHYDYLNKSRKASRIATTVLFAIGFSILALLSLRVFVRVLWTWSVT